MGRASETVLRHSIHCRRSGFSFLCFHCDRTHRSFIVCSLGYKKLAPIAKNPLKSITTDTGTIYRSIKLGAVAFDLYNGNLFVFTSKVKISTLPTRSLLNYRDLPIERDHIIKFRKKKSKASLMSGNITS